MAGPVEFYAMQPNAAGGEISEDVANRIDLDKYQMAMLQAENAVVRPYGAIQKRPGTIFCGEAKYSDKKAILVRFDFLTEVAYMLEMGDNYIRIWRDGIYLNIELQTPFQESDLAHLRFIQSVDVMYITSGKYPVKKLMRYAENNWQLIDMPFNPPAFNEVNKDEGNGMTPSGTSGTIALITDADTFTQDMIGDWIKIEQRVSGQTTSNNSGGNNTTVVQASEYVSTDGQAKIYTSGSWSGVIILQKEDGSYIQTFPSNNDKNYDQLTNTNNREKWRLLLSINKGNCNVSCGPVSLSANAGGGGSSDWIQVGDTWKIITHGTWSGSVVVEKSTDNGATWLQERKYTSANDYNPTESGSVDDYCLMRVIAYISSGNCTADLSSYPYTHTGFVQIVGVTDGKHATAVVKDILGNTARTINWYMTAWSKTAGYPIACAFFQDRMVFAGSTSKPSRIWMSKSGDYENFGVDKESGTVTDDSSISADIINLKSFTVKHMAAGNDLIVLTEGSEWTIAGAETVTPTSITPRNQQNYGSNETIPILVGNRLIYVQRRGSIIRDMGYSYDTDSYLGMDLTLLAKHLIRNHEIQYSAFTQEPDSIVYFIRDDGVMICLTYVADQKVYGWWHMATDGEFEAVTSIPSGNSDAIYTIVKREINGETKRYIERFAQENDSSNQQDHIMMDCAKIYKKENPEAECSDLEYLKGKEVYAMADGYLYNKMKVTAGKITLPAAATNITVGLPYTMIIEQPNFDITLKDSGTVQGRKKLISGVKLYLSKSYGGKIGQTPDNLNDIVYDSGYMQINDKKSILYSGYISPSMPGGFNDIGRVYIKHEEPYSFRLSAIIRAVTIGG